MTAKQRASLERFIGRKATLGDVQVIESLCATRRRAILRTAKVVELGSGDTVALGIRRGTAGKVLR